MPLGSQIAEHLPFLRRYARALAGSQREGDALVRATLESAVASVEARHGFKNARVPLYAAFTRIWQSAQVEQTRKVDRLSTHESTTRVHSPAIASRQREALLLMALEEFNSAQAGQIMGISAAEAVALAGAAAANTAQRAGMPVLIIEDEPLIAMQLQQIVASMGLAVSGTAATRSQAVQFAAEQQTALILADIQLADGSSGFDAVADIQARSPDLPVIFITAYPERLLTGDRPEPTFLLSKPFHENAVRAAISQALLLVPPGEWP